MKKKRVPEIDDIRGISILVMILIHTNAYFLAVPLSYLTLELSQFAVVAFIFCSAYLFYLKEPRFTVAEFTSHLFGRLKRLVLPYYLFLALYTFLVYLNTPKTVTPAYVFQNITLTGGIDFNWLVLLFLELAVLMPVLHFLYVKLRPLYMLYIFLAVCSSVIFLFITPLPNYRFIMWLPWSLVISYALHMETVGKRMHHFILVTVLFFVAFLVAQQFVLVPFHHSLRMYDNKYPPNLYHLAYGFFAVNVLYFASRRGLFRPFGRIIHFFSVNSYSIFFIHIIVIYVLTVFFRIKFNWVTFFLATAGVTTIVQILLNFLTAFLRYTAARLSGRLPARAD